MFEDPPASRIARAATVAAWAALGAAAAWTAAAAGWMLLALLWRRELFVPEAARSTAAALALAAGWALAVFVGFRLWARHNYRRYYLRNRRRLEPLPPGAPAQGWAEAVLTAQGTLATRSRAAALRCRRDPRGASAARLLSEAAVLMRESDPRSAAGLLRLALSDPRAGPAVRGSAARLLCACAARLGRAGEAVASKIRDSRLKEGG